MSEQNEPKDMLLETVQKRLNFWIGVKKKFYMDSSIKIGRWAELDTFCFVRIARVLKEASDYYNVFLTVYGNENRGNNKQSD